MMKIVDIIDNKYTVTTNDHGEAIQTLTVPSGEFKWISISANAKYNDLYIYGSLSNPIIHYSLTGSYITIDSDINDEVNNSAGEVLIGSNVIIKAQTYVDKSIVLRNKICLHYCYLIC